MPEFVLHEPDFGSGDPFLAEMTYDTPKSGSMFDAWRAEIDAFYREMRKFDSMDLHSVFMRLSAFSARAAEMRTQLARDDSRRAASMRTKEIEPFLNDLEFQFKVHSRAHSVQEMDFKMSGGAT